MHFQKMEKHNVEYNCADKTNYGVSYITYFPTVKQYK